MNTPKWQQVYQRALGRVVTGSATKGSARQMPIVRRPEKEEQRRALQDAATALAALWKQPLKSH